MVLAGRHIGQDLQWAAQPMALSPGHVGEGNVTNVHRGGPLPPLSQLASTLPDVSFPERRGSGPLLPISQRTTRADWWRLLAEDAVMAPAPPPAATAVPSPPRASLAQPAPAWGQAGTAYPAFGGGQSLGLAAPRTTVVSGELPSWAEGPHQPAAMVLAGSAPAAAGHLSRPRFPFPSTRPYRAVKSESPASEDSYDSSPSSFTALKTTPMSTVSAGIKRPVVTVAHHPPAKGKKASRKTGSKTVAESKRRKVRMCRFPDCSKVSQTGGFCISHGGGRRCSVDGCLSSVQKGRLCARHGGRRLCTFGDCKKYRVRRAMCIQHYRIVHGHGGGR